jgi:hypothetical protein
MDLKSELRKLLYGTTEIPQMLDLSTASDLKKYLWNYINDNDNDNDNKLFNILNSLANDYLRISKINLNLVWPSKVIDKRVNDFRNLTNSTTYINARFKALTFINYLRQDSYVYTFKTRNQTLFYCVFSYYPTIELDLRSLGIDPLSFSTTEQSSYLYNGQTRKLISKSDSLTLADIIEKAISELHTYVNRYELSEEPTSPIQKYKDYVISSAKELMKSYEPIVISGSTTSEFDNLISFISSPEKYSFPLGLLNLSKYSMSEEKVLTGSSTINGVVVSTYVVNVVYEKSLIIYINGEYSGLSTFLNYKRAYSLLFKPNFTFFNFLIVIRDHYTLYQSTSFLFANSAMKERLSYIIGKNFLKLLDSQLVLLAPDSLNGSDVMKFIQLTTMGYLRQGDIITTNLMPYFKYEDDVAGIMNRISAMSPLVNGNKVTPSFITNIVGTDVTISSMPNGKMVVKVINDILSEADKVFTYMGL